MIDENVLDGIKPETIAQMVNDLQARLDAADINDPIGDWDRTTEHLIGYLVICMGEEWVIEHIPAYGS